MYHILHLSTLYTTTYHPSSCDYSCFRLGEPVGCLESRPRLAWPSHATRLSLKLLEQLSSTLCCSGIRTANLQIDSPRKYHYATEKYGFLKSIFILFSNISISFSKIGWVYKKKLISKKYIYKYFLTK